MFSLGVLILRFLGVGRLRFLAFGDAFLNVFLEFLDESRLMSSSDSLL